MKNYDLLDKQDFERAVEESGLDRAVLSAIRFGLIYGSKSTFTSVRPDEKIGPVTQYATNVVNLAAYRHLKTFGRRMF